MPTNWTSRIEADHRPLVDADLGAVDGRHADDRADAVVVDQEGQQHQEALAVAAELARRLGQPSQSGPDRALAAEFVAGEDGLRLGHAAEQRDREDEPPDGDRQEGQPGGQGGLRLAQVRRPRKAEPRGLLKYQARLRASRSPPPR